MSTRVHIQLRKFERIVMRWLVDAGANGIIDIYRLSSNRALPERRLRDAIKQTLRNLEAKGCVTAPVDERGWLPTPLGERLLRGQVSGLSIKIAA